MDLKIYSNPGCMQHRLFPGFAEKPARLGALASLFNSLSLPLVCTDMVLRSHLEQAHDPFYIDRVQQMSERGFVAGLVAGFTTPEVQWYTRVSPGSYRAACYAAGAVVDAVDSAMTGAGSAGFCAVRPPGHHAGRRRGEGFCLFNNVAVGALYARREWGARVAVVDFDRHHGNGTQEILSACKGSDMLFASSYQKGCKYAGNAGTGSFPIAIAATVDDVMAAYRTNLLPDLRAFSPDLLIISAGFDMHVSDPLSKIRMRSPDYFTLTDAIVDAAGTARVVSVLEGGYDTAALAECVTHHLRALAP